MLQDRITPAVFLAQQPGTHEALADVPGGAGLPLAGVGAVVALLVLVLAVLLLVRSRRSDGAAALAEPAHSAESTATAEGPAAAAPAEGPAPVAPLAPAPTFFSGALAADLLPSRPAGRGLRRSGAPRRPAKPPVRPQSAAPETAPAMVTSGSPQPEVAGVLVAAAATVEPFAVPQVPASPQSVVAAAGGPVLGAAPSPQPMFGAAPEAQRVLDAGPAAAEPPSVFGALPLPPAEPMTWLVQTPDAPSAEVDASSLFRPVPRVAEDHDRVGGLAAPTSWTPVEPVTPERAVEHLAAAPPTDDDTGDVFGTEPVPTPAKAPPAPAPGPGSTARAGSDVRSMLSGRSQRL